jgi:hypothetical protein
MSSPDLLIIYAGSEGPKGDTGATGATGAKGEKAVNWKGAYDNSTNYIIDDAVSYNGSSYICKLASIGNLPTNSTYWDLLAQKGTDGTGVIVLGTPINSTSGTAISFTSIPSWVKKINIMFNGVSSTGISDWAIQLGSSSFQTTDYKCAFGYIGSTVASFNFTTGFALYNDNSSDVRNGLLTLSLLDSSNNIWAIGGVLSWSGRAYILPTSGVVALSGVLDRLRIITVNGTDTFDLGSINILYEG